MKELFGFDAFSPKEIAERVENIGVAKVKLPLISLLMLGVLAGAFIGLGAMFFTIVNSDNTIPFSINRVLGGLVFSLGLILVVVAGAELFTGNNLLIMAYADGKITLADVLKNWLLVCLANFIGAAGIAVIVYLSNHPQMNQEGIAAKYLQIAEAKCSLSFQHAFFSGMLCNVLVCLAVWMAQAGRSIIDKAIVIIFPVTAFVAAGFEHSIANMYFIPMGLLLKSHNSISYEAISLSGLFNNLGPVILGNLTGGSLFVGLFYYVIYGRTKSEIKGKDL